MSRGGSRELRIIGGRWRSRRLRFQDIEGLRPTPDRVRETLYNWLQAEVPGRHVLDLFAGSGALGFEALSRGAASLTMLERDVRQAASLRQAASDLQADACTVIRDDSLRWLSRAPLPATPYGIVLLDPPFHQNLPNQAIAMLHDRGWLVPDQWLYVETEQAPETLALPPGWRLHRQTRAGLVHALLFHREEEDAQDVE